VLAALEFAQTRLPARRHLSGVELAWACRDFALEQFGMLASAVMTHWGIHTTDDFGQIVFMLIDVGLLAASRTIASRTSSASTSSPRSSRPERAIAGRESPLRGEHPSAGRQRAVLSF